MIDALCGVAPEEDFVLPDGDVEIWTVNQVAGWAATKLSARTAQALRTNEVDGALLVELSKESMLTFAVYRASPNNQWVNVGGVLRRLLHLRRDTTEMQARCR